MVFETPGDSIHHFYFELVEQVFVAVLLMLEDDMEAVLVEEGLFEGVLQGVVAEDSQVFVYLGHQHVFLEDCDELLSDHVGQVFAEPIDAFGPDHHVFLVQVSSYFLGERA